MPIIILKDADRNPITDTAGNPVEVEVSQAIAVFLEKNDRYIASQHDNDQRYFQLIHFDTPAWENLQGLSTMFSAEDECLGVPAEIAEAEHARYMNRLARCRRAYRMLNEVCTPTQWRRLILYKVHKLTFPEIAEKEGRCLSSIYESIEGAERKLNNLIKNLRD